MSRLRFIPILIISMLFVSLSTHLIAMTPLPVRIEHKTKPTPLLKKTIEPTSPSKEAVIPPEPASSPTPSDNATTPSISVDVVAPTDLPMVVPANVTAEISTLTPTHVSNGAPIVPADVTAVPSTAYPTTPVAPTVSPKTYYQCPHCNAQIQVSMEPKNEIKFSDAPKAPPTIDSEPIVPARAIETPINIPERDVERIPPRRTPE